MAEQMILKYLRDTRTNRKKGVVVAVANDKVWALGVSVTNVKAGDTFDAGRGIEMAHGRALKALGLKVAHVAAGSQAVDEGVQTKIVPYTPTVEVPVGVFTEVEEFWSRSAKYFKDKEPGCRIEANVTKMNFDQSVAELTKLFETDRNRSKRESVPPSLRGKDLFKAQQGMPAVTEADVQEMQRIATAIQGLDWNQGTSNLGKTKPVTRVLKT